MSARSSSGRPSTDGTELGADIAEVFGTTSEDIIIQLGYEHQKERVRSLLTGMEEEQRDWEAGREED